MSDTTPAGTPEPVAAETAATTSEPLRLPDDHPLVKTLATLREENKGLKSKAGRLDEIEEAQKTELQKAQDRAEAAERRASDAEAARLKASTAARFGVPEELLAGSTAEELESSAERLIAFKGPQPTAPSPDGQGAVGVPISSQTKQITSLDELSKLSPAEVNQARREGRLDSLLGNS
jgi:hypothetical protein